MWRAKPDARLLLREDLSAVAQGLAAAEDAESVLEGLSVLGLFIP